MFEFEYIKFRNFLSYPAVNTEFQFKTGLHSIIGTNGRGKSTIQDALCYNLYGKAYRNINLADLISWTNKKDLYTESKFKSGRDEYIVRRGMKPSIFEIVKNGQKLQLLSGSSLIQEELDKILGIDYKMFKNIVSLSINYNKPFLELSKQEKRDTIEVIFNVNVFGVMLKALKKRISNLKTEIEIEKNNLATLQESIDETKKHYETVLESEIEFNNEKELDLQTCKSDIETKNRTIEDLQSKIIDIEKEIEQLDIQKDKFINTTKEKIIQKEKEIQKEIERLILEKETKRNELESLNAGIDSELIKTNNDYEQRINNLNESLKALQQEKQDIIDKCTKKIKHVNECLDKTLNDLYKEKNSIIVEDESTLQTKLQDLKGDEKYNKRQIEEYESKIEFFTNNSVCPECEEPISNDKRNQKCSEKKSKIEKLIVTNEKLLFDIVKIEKAIVLAKENRDKITLIETKIERINTASEKKILEYNTEIDKCKNSLDVVNLENVIKIVKNEYNQSNEKAKRLKQEIQDDLKDLDHNYSKEIELAKNNTVIDQFKREIEKYENREKQRFLDQKIINNKEKIESLERDLILLSNRIEEIKEKKFSINIEEIRELLEQKQAKFEKNNTSYKKNLNIWDNYTIGKEVLGDSGLKSYFFKKLMPILNQKINNYLSLFNLPVCLQFDNEMNENITSINGRNENLNYNSFSGGERKRIDISVLLSFIDITKTITNWSCNLLFIDELFDSAIDGDGLTQMIKTLKDMVDSNSKFSVYLISHKLQDMGYFDSIIEIEKRNNFSYIKEN